MNDTTWNCGNAGDRFWIQQNAFQYTSDKAIHIRGTPRGPSYIDRNVFAHEKLEDALEPTERANVYVGGVAGQYPNTVGVDTFGQYGVCDLDGDRQDDLFLATGVSWWYSSGARMQWTYLRGDYTELKPQLGFGDFDADGRCDVIAKNTATNALEISRGGKEKWKALPGTFAMPFNQLRFADFNGDGRTDIFHRDPSGQWSVISPGVHDWRLIASSVYALNRLRFGDFNGDGITDVLSPSGDQWSVSWSGTSAWERLNAKLFDDLQSLVITDLDADGIDDIVRLALVQSKSAPPTTRADVSWGGRSGWTALGTFPATTFLLGGRFDVWDGGDVLAIDRTSRTSRLFSSGHSNFDPYGLYAY